MSLLDNIRPVAKAVVAFIAPGVVTLGSAITAASDGGTRITPTEWVTAIIACFATAAIVYAVPNRPKPATPIPPTGDPAAELGGSWAARHSAGAEDSPKPGPVTRRLLTLLAAALLLLGITAAPAAAVVKQQNNRNSHGVIYARNCIGSSSSCALQIVHPGEWFAKKLAMPGYGWKMCHVAGDTKRCITGSTYVDVSGFKDLGVSWIVYPT